MDALLLLAIVILGLFMARLNTRVTQVEYAMVKLRRAIAMSEAAAPSAPEAPTSARQDLPASPTPAAAPSPAPEPPPPLPTSPTAAPRRGEVNLEQTLLGRWAVWVGAVAIALGGVFLVRYSIERELLGPGARVILGLLLGIGLTAAGEFLRHHLPPADPGRVAYIPPAVTGAGIAVLFASVYAAYALYDFITGLAAFVALAGISGTAVTLSLRQGPFIALLGLAGAFSVPALVRSDSPSEWVLFGYLLIVVVGCLALVRARRWWWLAWATLAGATVWPLIWLAQRPPNSDPLALAGFLLLSVLAFQLVRRRNAPPETDPSQPLLGDEPVLWAVAGSFALITLAHVNITRYDNTALLGAALLMVLYLAWGYRDALFDRLSWIAGGLAVTSILAWNAPRWPVILPDPLAIPPAFPPMLTTAVAFAALIGGAGFVALTRAPHPERWAFASAATPLALLATLYLHNANAIGEWPWAAMGLTLAALNVAAAAHVANWRAQPGMELALAAYALATVAAISLAATMSLERNWLTVALALQLPAIAWVSERLRLDVLRHLALALAAIVIARLFLNPTLYTAQVASVPVFNWLIYSFGVPALAFGVAAHLFSAKRDHLVVVLEAGTVAIGVTLVGLEIRNVFGDGPLITGRLSLAELAVHANLWFGVALLLHRLAAQHGSPTYKASADLIGIASAVLVGLGVLLIKNPLLVREPVGESLVFNLLLPLYATPAALCVGLQQVAARREPREPAPAFALMALVLGFAFLSLTVRQAFHGTILAGGPVIDGENYTYSLVWLLYGAGLLAGGVLARVTLVRYAGLATLALAVGKTFLLDMSALTGLYRAASFIGLGAALIGLGYLYQRFVRPNGERSS